MLTLQVVYYIRVRRRVCLSVCACACCTLPFRWTEPLDSRVIPFEAFSDRAVKSMKSGALSAAKSTAHGLVASLHADTKPNPNTHLSETFRFQKAIPKKNEMKTVNIAGCVRDQNHYVVK